MKYEDMIKNQKLYNSYLLKYRDYYCNKYNLSEDEEFLFDENAFREFYANYHESRTPKRILFDLGLTEEEAILLFKHLFSEVEEESYEASQRMYEETAKRCGFDSYMDYLEHFPERF